MIFFAIKSNKIKTFFFFLSTFQESNLTFVFWKIVRFVKAYERFESKWKPSQLSMWERFPFNLKNHSWILICFELTIFLLVSCKMHDSTQVFLYIHTEFLCQTSFEFFFFLLISFNPIFLYITWFKGKIMWNA